MIAINSGGIVFDYNTTSARIQYASGIGNISRAEVALPNVSTSGIVQITPFPIHNFYNKVLQESCYLVTDIFISSETQATQQISIYRGQWSVTTIDLYNQTQTVDARTLAFRYIWGPYTISTANTANTIANDGGDFTMGMYINHNAGAARDYIISVFSYDIAVGPYNSLTT